MNTKEEYFAMDLEECSVHLENALMKLRNTKPEDRSETSRRFAITITELEKVIAYFETWILREQEKEEQSC